MLSLLLSVTPANAVLTGNELHEKCSRPADEPMCVYFISGAIDGTMAFGFTIKQLPFCPPNEVTYGQMIDVSKRYLRDHPEDRDLWASQLVLKAMKQTWPCQK